MCKKIKCSPAESVILRRSTVPESSCVLVDLSDWRLTRWDLTQRALRVDRSFSCSWNWSHPLLLGRRSS